MHEVKRELASRGVSMDIMFKIMTAEPEPMNDDAPEGSEVIDAEPVQPDA